MNESRGKRHSQQRENMPYAQYILSHSTGLHLSLRRTYSILMYEQNGSLSDTLSCTVSIILNS